MIFQRIEKEFFLLNNVLLMIILQLSFKIFELSISRLQD